jgi:hypothetical protein
MSQIPPKAKEGIEELKQQLHRLIIENRDETGAIDPSDQSAMADEILAIFQEQVKEIEKGLPKELIERNDIFPSQFQIGYDNFQAGYNHALQEVRKLLEKRLK